MTSQGCGVSRIDTAYLARMKESFLRTPGGKMEVLQLCMDLGLVVERYECPKCKSEMRLKKDKGTDGYFWECRVRRVNENHSVKPCVRKGSWLERSNLSMIDILIMTEYFVSKRTNKDVMYELHFSKTSVIDWRAFFREVCVEIALNNSEKIGGVDVVVEIDESKLEKQYDKEKRVRGRWMYAGTERESTKCFLVVVKSRDKETLLSLIKDNIYPGTTIVSDCWSSYNCLEDEGFKQLKVDHSLTFKAHEAGAQGAAKSKLPARRVSGSLGTYLAEYIWFRYHRDTHDLMLTFLQEIKKIYVPMTKDEEELPESSNSDTGSDTE